MTQLPHSTQLDTVQALLGKSQRKRGVPLRRTFLQRKSEQALTPGPLHQLVRRQDELALDLYLLLLLVAVKEPYHVSLEAGVWARAAGLGPGTSSRTLVSRAWRRLADLQLLTRARAAGRARLTLLQEDGSGSPYARPDGTPRASEQYLNIPLAYWQGEWYAYLSLRAKAVLLIALSLKAGFLLPSEKGPAWYGVSSDTIQRGIGELEHSGLLTHSSTPKKAPLTAQGWAIDRLYTLLPFPESGSPNDAR